MEREYIGRYHIIEQLAEGGMGTVLRAEDEVRKREVAIKVPNESDPRVISRLQKECDVLTRLEHHHIVQVFGSGSDTGLPFYIVMEYVDGVTVETLLREQGGPLEPRRALKIAQDVAEALAYAHRPSHRIIHRDIKPANVMIRRKDGVVKVTDFGIAAVLVEQAGLTAVGTMAYMAPEQAQGKGIDERADLYALGGLLYEMLTGQRPPQLAVTPATPPSAVPGVTLPPELSEGIDRLVIGLLERERRQRQPQQATEVVQQLRWLLEGRPDELRGSDPLPLPSQATERASRPLHDGISPALLPQPLAPKPRPSALPQPPVVQVVQVVPMVAPTDSGKALTSLILGLFAMMMICFVVGGLFLANGDPLLRAVVVGLSILPGLFGVVLGHVALGQIRSSAGRLGGRGQAIAGLVLGYISLGVVLLVFLTSLVF